MTPELQDTLDRMHARYRAMARWEEGRKHRLAGRWAATRLFVHALNAIASQGDRTIELESPSHRKANTAEAHINAMRPEKHCGVPTSSGDTGCRVCHKSFLGG